MSQKPPTHELFRDLFGSDEDDDVDLEQLKATPVSSQPHDTPVHPFYRWKLLDQTPPIEFPTQCFAGAQRLWAATGPVCPTYATDTQGCKIIRPLPGLVIIRRLLCSHLQQYLLERFINLGYFSSTETNQMMHFGPLPTPLQWVAELYAQLAPRWFDNSNSGEPHKTNNCWSRQPLFDQLIGNMYLPGEGIRPHVDLARFEDGIGIVSLGSTCTMVFAHPDREQQHALWLEPGDVLAMSGEARYQWTHAIPAQKVDQVDGIARPRSLRVSLTLRRVCPWACVG
ncbi:hypothetical protein IWQ62_004030 [Dispira parvispora]|uniref:Fe2OG dioxygenase domain-containing protein n=1 Tax=Dispira parvispora TaxID=1520584 RepID=A0A9W8AME0_9FUNG|nr:hypothetical protein IWQ62_004030 [Dispira parvispora]